VLAVAQLEADDEHNDAPWKPNPPLKFLPSIPSELRRTSVAILSLR
jgi:hypothetical protein